MVKQFAVEQYPSLGMNTALNPAQLPKGAQRRAYDAVMRAVDTIGKRDGSAPVTTTALTDPITHLLTYKAKPSAEAVPELFAVSKDKLYKYVNGELVAQTMTNAFATPDVFSVAFSDGFADPKTSSASNSSVSVLLMTDGGTLKQYDGTAVKNVVAKSNDASPAPPNDLTAINGKKPKYIWSHTGHVFMSAGTDLIWYSKRYSFDYWPNTQYFRYVRNNDYITGPGVTFNGLCLIPMRRGWAVLMGEVFDDGEVANGFKGNEFLNTVNGNISSRGFDKVTYPTGQQTIIYLSDDGVHEIYDTGFASDGVRQYSTRSLMKDKVDFLSYGFTEAEKAAAVSYFDVENSIFILSIKRDTSNYAFVYDTRNQEWYLWRFPWPLQALTKWNDTLYYGSTTGLVHGFSDVLYSDWNDKAKTSGTPIDFDVYSGLISFEFTGDGSYLHYYLVEAEMHRRKSTLDVYLIHGSSVVRMDKALLNEIFVWGVTAWGEGQWANLDFTDNVNNAKRLVIHKKAKYFQRRWRNNRDEPVLILKERFEGTLSGR